MSWANVIIEKKNFEVIAIDCFEFYSDIAKTIAIPLYHSIILLNHFLM